MSLWNETGVSFRSHSTPFRTLKSFFVHILYQRARRHNEACRNTLEAQYAMHLQMLMNSTQTTKSIYLIMGNDFVDAAIRKWFNRFSEKHFSPTWMYVGPV